MTTLLVPDTAGGRRGSAPPGAAAPDGRPPVVAAAPALRWHRWVVRACVVADLVAITTAVAFAVVVLPGSAHRSPRALLFAIGEIPVWMLALNLGRAHELRFLTVGSEEFRRVFDAAVRLAALVAIVAYGLQASLPRSLVAVALPLAVVLDLTFRYGIRKGVHALRRRGRLTSRMLVVGTRRSVADLVPEFRNTPHVGMRIVGCCVDHPYGRSPLPAGVPVLGTLDRVREIAVAHRVTAIAVAGDHGLDRDFLRSLAWSLEGTEIELMVAPTVMDCVGPRIHIRPVAGLPLLHIEKPELRGGRRLLKIVVDRVLAALILLALLPLLLSVAVLVRATSAGPALFRQRRVGRDGRLFTLLKFRTMYVDAEARREQLAELDVHHGDGPLFKVRHDPRVTRVGRFLRRYSIDELPQLVNVLRGDMSLVGPRPPLPAEVETYVGPTGRRMLVSPGLTGLWQISGRADLEWHESVRLDLYYVENWSLALDALILWKTVPAVLRHRGAY